MRDAAAQQPAWAQWNEEAGLQPWTVGLEEELMLLQPPGWGLANRIDDLLDVLPRRWASAETHACVVELKTAPSPTVAGAIAQLTAQRVALRIAARARLGLCVAAAGTHPLAHGTEAEVSRRPRYSEIEATTRVLARREPTMALHVHVAVPDGAAGVRALDGLRSDLPLLLALAANSPYWCGEDSGFASMRTPIFSMFPRVGIPERFGSYRRYVRVVDRLLRSVAVPEPSFLWWDARLQPRLGTVEVRIMDAQTRLADTAALAALVQCLVRRYAEDGPPRSWDAPEVLAENRFLAARDGVSAELIRTSPARGWALDGIADLLRDCAPLATQLGCRVELAGVGALASSPGYERQRRLAAVGGGVEAVAPGLVGEFAATERRAPAAA